MASRPISSTPARRIPTTANTSTAGQCFTQPYLGCREFSAHFELVEEFPASPLTGTQDLGWMLHDIDFPNEMEARFFRASMVDGVIAVPAFPWKEVKA